MLEEAALSLSGTLAALVHVPAGDEILKNSFANYASEYFEIAAYKSLLTRADDGGFASSSALLSQSLTEEQRTAARINEALPTVTRLYAEGDASAAKV